MSKTFKVINGCLYELDEDSPFTRILGYKVPAWVEDELNKLANENKYLQAKLKKAEDAFLKAMGFEPL